MKPIPLFSAGIAATLAGALLRSCETGSPAEFVVEWCGPTTQAVSASAAHIHCAGCGVMELGALLVVLALATALIQRADRFRGVQAR